MSKRLSIPDNALTTSPHYGEILKEYNDRFARDGKVKLLPFWRDIVSLRVPGFSYQSFRNFVMKFETAAGLEMEKFQTLHPTAIPEVEQNRAIVQLKDAAVATREGIARALNIGLEALQEIIDNPHLVSSEKRAALLFQAMKAQDSRIAATAKVRHDVREQVKFNKMFSRAAFVGSDGDVS